MYPPCQIVADDSDWSPLPVTKSVHAARRPAALAAPAGVSAPRLFRGQYAVNQSVRYVTGQKTRTKLVNAYRYCSPDTTS